MNKYRLPKGDVIVTAFAESARGPGWSNQPIWLIIMDGDRKLRQECIQPNEQTAAELTLYGVSQAAHSAMTLETRRRERP